MSYAPVHTDPLGLFPAQMKRIAEETEAKVAASTRFSFWTGTLTPDASGLMYLAFPDLGTLEGAVVQQAEPGLLGYTEANGYVQGYHYAALTWQGWGAPAGVAMWIKQTTMTTLAPTSETWSGSSPGALEQRGRYRNPMQICVIAWGSPK